MDAEDFKILRTLFCSSLMLIGLSGFICRALPRLKMKETLSASRKATSAFMLSILIFWAGGYALSFNPEGSPILGSLTSPIDFSDQEDFLILLFHGTLFAAMPLILSLALARSIKFGPLLLLVGLYMLCIEAPLINMVWGGKPSGGLFKLISFREGWLYGMDVRDFYGAGILHLSMALFLGSVLWIAEPPAGDIAQEEMQMPVPVRSGAPMLSIFAPFLLWLFFIGLVNGFYGFHLYGFAPTNGSLILAAAATALAAPWFTRKRPSHIRAFAVTDGFLLGMLCLMGGVHPLPLSGILLSCVLGLTLWVLFLRLLESSQRLNDPTGTLPLHLAGGLAGFLSIGLFFNPRLLDTGNFLPGQFKAQLIGLIVIASLSISIGLLAATLLRRLEKLAYDAEDDFIGADAADGLGRTEAAALQAALHLDCLKKTNGFDVHDAPLDEIGLIAQHYREETESAREKSEAADTVMETSRDAIVTFAPESENFAVRHTSSAAEELMGYPEAAIRGRSAASILTIIEPDLNYTRDAKKLYQERMTGQKIEKTELMAFLDKLPDNDTISLLHVKKSDGSLIPVEAVFSYTEDSETPFWTAILRPQEEAQPAEKSTIVSRSHLAILSTLTRKSLHQADKEDV